MADGLVIGLGSAAFVTMVAGASPVQSSPLATCVTVAVAEVIVAFVIKVAANG